MMPAARRSDRARTREPRTPAVIVAAAALLIACGNKKKEDSRPRGKLCFAANGAELFKWEKDGVATDYSEGKPIAIKYRGKAIALPNAQVGFDDAREGEPVAVTRDDKLVESWKVNFQRLGTDLCYYWRGFDPAKPERKPGWILDANGADDRCTCYEPAAPVGAAGSAGSAAGGK